MIFPHFVMVTCATRCGPLPALPGYELVVIPGTLLKARRPSDGQGFYVQRADAAGGHRLIPVQSRPVFRVDFAGAIELPAHRPQ